MQLQTLEICAASVASCIAAEEGGAGRIELCAALTEGGTTPSFGMVAQVLERVSIPVFPIIRPRGGDFLYTPDEVEVMEADIRMLVDLGVPGVVIGALTPQGALDTATMQRLIEAAQGREVTLHRAFDMVAQQSQALEEAISLGCTRILTSGAAPTAYEGIPRLAQLIVQAAGRITIMPGSGVKAHNIRDIVAETGAVEVHASLKEAVPSRMIYRNSSVSMGGTVTFDEYSQNVTSAAAVRATLAALA